MIVEQTMANWSSLCSAQNTVVTYLRVNTIMLLRSREVERIWQEEHGMRDCKSGKVFAVVLCQRLRLLRGWFSWGDERGRKLMEAACG